MSLQDDPDQYLFVTMINLESCRRFQGGCSFCTAGASPVPLMRYPRSPGASPFAAVIRMQLTLRKYGRVWIYIRQRESKTLLCCLFSNCGSQSLRWPGRWGALRGDILTDTRMKHKLWRYIYIYKKYGTSQVSIQSYSGGCWGVYVHGNQKAQGGGRGHQGGRQGGAGVGLRW